LKEIVIEEAYRTIKVTEGKRQISIPMAKAVMGALAVNAARGQLRSQQVFTKLLAETERAHSPVAKGAARVDALRKSHGIDCASAFSTHPRG
jgi:hypothetical protein